MSTIQDTISTLTAPKPTQPKAAPIATNVNMPSLRGKIGHALGTTELVLRNKIVHVLYINGANNSVEAVLTLKTTHRFIAAIMNLFAKHFPKYGQGAAKFSIGDQECYVRRSLIQDTFPAAEIPRHAFSGGNQQNTHELENAAKKHFVRA